MGIDFTEAYRDVSAFIAALRRIIDRPLRTRSISSDVQREMIMNTMMMVEEARIRFQTYVHYRDEANLSDWVSARRDLLKFVDKFLHADDIDRSIFERQFIVAPMLSRDREKPTPFIKEMITDQENFYTLFEALIRFHDYLLRLDVTSPPIQESIAFNELNKIVPKQQVAPVQFDIKQNRIVVSQQPPQRNEADKSNIDSAIEHLHGSGDRLIEQLELSNCDRRLLDSVKELQSSLINNENIVKIGLANIACGVMSSQFQKELPDAIIGMFSSYNSSISLYVAQFPEWEQFTQKAAAIELDEADLNELDTATSNVLECLAENPEIADDEVPRTIAYVRQFLRFPGHSAKRAAFALIRTLENLVSSIVRYSVSFVSSTATKVLDAGSTAASKVIVGLLTVALVSALGIGPTAVRAGAPWVKQAAEVVQKQIEKMAG